MGARATEHPLVANLRVVVERLKMAGFCLPLTGGTRPIAAVQTRPFKRQISSSAFGENPLSGVTSVKGQRPRERNQHSAARPFEP